MLIIIYNRLELQKIIVSIQNFGKFHLFESQVLYENKFAVETAIIQHRNDIATCFNYDSFNECRSYVVSNFICRNAFPQSTLLYQFATNKDVTKLTCANLIDSYTKLK